MRILTSYFVGFVNYGLPNTHKAHNLGKQIERKESNQRAWTNGTFPSFPVPLSSKWAVVNGSWVGTFNQRKFTIGYQPSNAITLNNSYLFSYTV